MSTSQLPGGRLYDLLGGTFAVRRPVQDDVVDADIGVDEVHVMDAGNDPVSFVRSLAPVVPALHEL